MNLWGTSLRGLPVFVLSLLCLAAVEIARAPDIVRVDPQARPAQQSLARGPERSSSESESSLEAALAFRESPPEREATLDHPAATAATKGVALRARNKGRFPVFAPRPAR